MGDSRYNALFDDLCHFSSDSKHAFILYHKRQVSSKAPGGTAIVLPSNMCFGENPVCETFCTNKGPKLH